MNDKKVIETLIHARSFLIKNEDRIGESQEFQELADEINETIASSGRTIQQEA